VSYATGERGIRGDELHAHARRGQRLDYASQGVVLCLAHFEAKLDASACVQVQGSPQRHEAAGFTDVVDLSAEEMAWLVGDSLHEAGAADSDALPAIHV